MTGPLTGLKVIDLATLFAGPLAAMHLGDMGADVVKVEHPRRPDPSLGHGPAKEVVQAFEQAEAAVGPVYDASDIAADPQLDALGTVLTVDDDLGPMAMQNVLFRMSGRPGQVRWTGRAHGADTDAVLGEAGYSAEEISSLRRDGVV